MNPRQKKRWLVAGAAGLGAIAVAIMVAGLSLPVRVDAKASDVGAKVVSTTSRDVKPREDQTKRLTLAQLQRLGAMPLRRPLYDAKQPVATNVSQQPVAKPMTLRLVGTINEPGHSMAMFQKSDGSIELCALNQSIDDAGGAVTVTHIEPNKVIVEYNGQSRDLEIPKRR